MSMLKDITLGQYFPGTSFIHRLDPRTKLVMLVVYIVALFTASGWIGYGIVFAFLATCI
jgi:energy-coupling factor transport system permease protein